MSIVMNIVVVQISPVTMVIWMVMLISSPTSVLIIYFPPLISNAS